MKTYQQLKTKDDDLFLAHAKRVLGSDYSYVMDCARQAFQSIRRPSEAKRAANMVILDALKDVGEEHWRKPKEGNEPPAKRIEITPQAVPPRKEGDKKWTGESILERADRERAERKKKGA